jgi:hypothetical protein
MASVRTGAVKNITTDEKAEKSETWINTHPNEWTDLDIDIHSNTLHY